MNDRAHVATPSHEARWLFLITWAVAAGYVLFNLDRGWFPVDTGTLGHAAERVLAGELPHRDFADVYTGGLAVLDALAFRVLGVGVMSMRWVVFAVFLAWVPAFWSLARRAAGPRLAALATLLGASWTLPIYAEGMPSWFNLFFATFGGAALLRYADTGARRWLFVAGLMGGCSVLIKVVGLYFIAAALLYVLWLEATSAPLPNRGSSGDADHGSDAPYRAFVTVGVGLLGAAVAWLVLRGMGFRNVFLYGAPPLAGVAASLPLLLRGSRIGTATRLANLARMLTPLAIGVLVPVAAFVTPYVMSGSVSDLVAGIFTRPSERLDAVRMIGPAGQWYFGGAALLLMAWHAWSPNAGSRAGRIAGVGVALLFLGALAVSHRDLAYVLTFRTMLWLGPLVCLAGAWRLLSQRAPEPAVAFLVLALYGLTSLVQIPFAAPAYFFYAAPLGILVALSCVGPPRSGRPPWMHLTVAVLLAFTVLRLNEGFTLDLGFRYRPSPHAERLALPRAMGLRVPAEDKSDYEGLVGLVEALEPGRTLYAGPDAPEVYFLTGTRNPTTTLYEVFDDLEVRERDVLAAIDREGVRVVVVRPRPLFSPPFSESFLSELEQRFPAGREVGRFMVAWDPGR